MIQITRTNADGSTSTGSFASTYQAISAWIQTPDREAIADAIGQDHNEVDVLRVHREVLLKLEDQIITARAEIDGAVTA